jgi:hypothetical protein
MSIKCSDGIIGKASWVAPVTLELTQKIVQTGRRHLRERTEIVTFQGTCVVQFYFASTSEYRLAGSVYSA